LDIGKNIIVWNRFFPSVLKFKKNDFAPVLKAITDSEFRSKIDAESLIHLKTNYIISDEDYEKIYLNQIEKFIEKRKNKLMLNIENKKPFSSLVLFFEKCNLYCSYCIMTHTWGKKEYKLLKKNTDQNNLYKNIIDVLDQQYNAMEKYPIDNFCITISGGEPLIKFDLLKKIITNIRFDKNDKKTPIDMNTNASLLKKNMIRFLIDNNVTLHISIDGNRMHHDSTRIYRNGEGSFDNIIKSILLLKKMGYPGDKLENFQGTLYNFDLLDKEEIFSFYSKLNFKLALLYPGLLGIDPETGTNNAVQFFDLYKKSLKKNPTLISSEIKKLADVLNPSRNGDYTPYCNGLGANLEILLLNYNIPNESLSYLCQFIPQLSKKRGKSINIFDMELFYESINYQFKRIESMRKYCFNCSIVGICNGGCILNGLNSFNEKNEGACSFWKTLWALYLKEYLTEE
ncbi:MAG: 4Fe-4S cluster-binding domain-containing protein, partial [Acidobacteria bacterium]|nr:4Fe-4S cluster-binding domain-containing protein [Acidobacteriota bacterium]